VAVANYEIKEGWHTLDIKASGDDNYLKAYASGHLEGYLYYEYINYHFTNIMSSIYNNKPLNDKTKKYMNDQWLYLEGLVEFSKFLGTQDDYTETLSLMLAQYKGLYEGYSVAIKDKNITAIPEDQFYYITMQADLEDIVEAFGNAKSIFKGKECTGYVKYIKEDNNLFVGHTTHNLYTLMNRIYKSYSLDITLSSGKKLNNFKYSGRPGDLNSKDDFYILSNRMVVLETSLDIWNDDLYKNLSTQTVPKWIRVNIANMLAIDGQDWINIFFLQNSGTHNNQWLVVDMNRFDAYLKTGDKDGIVFLVEQIPMLNNRYFKDMSSQLFEDTYITSHNAPYFKEVIDLAGYTSHNKPDYFHANRYKIFKMIDRLMDIKTIEDVQTVMRYHDALNMCDTIAPRCDIGSTTPFGAVDSKITSYELINDMKAYIIQGPPHIKGLSEPFEWDKFSTWSHLGMPDKYDFNWLNI
jgi:hypothetical protein